MKKVLELTGIQTVDTDKLQDADAPVYNLTGQQVDRGHKGIVISNGRKYVKNKTGGEREKKSLPKDFLGEA